MSDERSRFEQLRAEVQYRRERLALYRARIYAQRPTSMTTLRARERELQAAEDRLAHAQGEQAQTRAAAERDAHQ